MFDNKTMYRIYYPSILQPKTICYRQNKFWFDCNGDIIDEAHALKAIEEYDTSFIKKATDSMGGHGIFCYEKCKNSIIEVKEYVNTFDSDVIVQCCLAQSAALSKLNDSSVNTIRVMSLLRKDGSLKICSSILRMGRAGSRVDNASSGGVTCGIDDNGKLKKIGFSPDGKSYTHHPTSHVKFDGYEIPNFDKVKGLVKKLAYMTPMFRLVSWDIALNEENQPVLIEANLYVGELEFHQLNNGPIFGDETNKILEEALGAFSKL